MPGVIESRGNSKSLVLGENDVIGEWPRAVAGRENPLERPPAPPTPPPLSVARLEWSGDVSRVVRPSIALSAALKAGDGAITERNGVGDGDGPSMCRSSTEGTCAIMDCAPPPTSGDGARSFFGVPARTTRGCSSAPAVAPRDGIGCGARDGIVLSTPAESPVAAYLRACVASL